MLKTYNIFHLIFIASYEKVKIDQQAKLFRNMTL